jgi:hypothetical protein
MEDKITIIEGPTPVFETSGDGWALGLNESPTLGNVAMTRLRTFNGPALVERCHRAWSDRRPIRLEFRQEDGLIDYAPIVAARAVDTPEGDMLLLWVRIPEEEIEVELNYDEDDFGDDDLEDEPGEEDDAEWLI